jgi:hypothetical protein
VLEIVPMKFSRLSITKPIALRRKATRKSQIITGLYSKPTVTRMYRVKRCLEILLRKKNWQNKCWTFCKNAFYMNIFPEQPES